MSRPGVLPVVLIAGYLGAGKTTLVNHLLRHAAGQRIAVLVNDFGSINIDADLIAAVANPPADPPSGSPHSTSVISLAGGCLCCSFGDDLVGSLAALAARQPPLDLCLMELSGVALPASVVQTARLVAAVDVVATLVLADAERIQQLVADRYVGDTVAQQLREADWVMLSKTDLVAPAALQATAVWLQQLHPQVQLWAGDVQAVWPELLLGWAAPDGQAASARVPALGSVAQPIALRKPGSAHAAALFESYTCTLPEAVDLPALGQLLATPASGVLRAKALVAGRLLQVAGGRYAVTPQEAGVSGPLVLIGLRGWNPQALLRTWEVAPRA